MLPLPVGRSNRPTHPVGAPTEPAGEVEDAAVIIHPTLTAEAERLVTRLKLAELGIRRRYTRVGAVAVGLWMSLDGFLFVLGGPARLTSPVFTFAEKVIPWWPVPFALFISAAGALLVYAAWTNQPLWGSVAHMAISAWQFAYWLLLWHAIAVPAPPPAKPVALPPISDHGALSAGSFLASLMLFHIYRLHHPGPTRLGRVLARFMPRTARIATLLTRIRWKRFRLDHAK